MRNSNGNQLAADQAHAVRGGRGVDDRSADPHRSLTAMVEAARTEEVEDLQAETIRAIPERVLGGQDPDNLILLKANRVGRLVGVRHADRLPVLTCR
jgi:hypothetical protein